MIQEQEKTYAGIAERLLCTYATDDNPKFSLIPPGVAIPDEFLVTRKDGTSLLRKNEKSGELLVYSPVLQAVLPKRGEVFSNDQSGNSMIK